MYVSPAETVDTVSVDTASFEAEQGNAGGAAITVITKSGTNNFSGSAFEFYNDENLNARPVLPVDEDACVGPYHWRNARRPGEEESAVLLRIM